MIERVESWTVRVTKRLIRRRRGGMAMVLCIVLAATTAMAQQSVGTTSETVTTVRERDLNGREAVIEKVATRVAQTNDEARVVVETYLPSIEAGRFALSRRVTRVTTETEDGSRTVEEIEEPSPVASSDPIRIVQRSVTTVRRGGNDSYVTEGEVFRTDANGRLVLVRKQIEQGSRRSTTR